MISVARGLGAAALAAALTLAPASGALSPAETARLAAGDSIVEYTDLKRGSQRFVGGVSYRIVDADADHLSRILRTPSRWAVLLPRVRDVELLAIDKHGYAHLRVTHGLGMFSGGYDIVIAFSEQGRFGRFWIDQHGDNDVVDGWGYVRLTALPSGKTLVTWAVLFDLGPGVTRALFEAKMQRAALDVPRRLAHAAAS